MRFLVILALLCAVAAADPKKVYRGVTVDIQLKQAPVADVFRILADTGQVNIVVIDVAPGKLDIVAKREPWDKVLDDLVARSGFEYVRFGNTFLVGSKAWVAARKKEKPQVYRGASVDVFVKDVDAVDATRLLAAISGDVFEVKPAAAKRVSFNLRRVAAGLVFDVIQAQSGAISTDKPAAPAPPGKACVVPTVDVKTLRLGAIAQRGTTRMALLVDAKGTGHLIQRGGCAGVQAAPLKDIGQGFVTFVVGSEELALQFYPVAVAP